MRVLLDPHKGIGTCAIGIGSQFGSRDEKSEFVGYTHFLEHMLFKSTTQRSTYQIASTIDRYGGLFNGYTDKEEFLLHLWLPSQQLDLGLDLLFEMFFKPAFLSQEIEKERLVVLSELESVQDDHEEQAADLFYRKLWPNNSLGNPVGGIPKNIQHISKESLVEFYEELLTTAPLSLVISGDFDDAAVREKLSRLEHAIPLKDKKNRIYEEALSLNIKEDLGFHQNQILMGNPIAGAPTFKDSCMGQILSNVIGETVSSRLFQALREEQGLCYSIASTISDYSDFQFFEIGAATVQTEKTFDEIKKELSKALSSGISEFEWQLAKDHYCGNLLIGKGDLDNQVRRFITGIHQGWTPKSTEEMVQYIQGIKTAELNLYSQKMIDHNWSSFIG